MTFTNFIKRPVLSTVISIVIVLLGFIGLVSLPIEQYPNIAPPNIVVMTSYPGADAETVKNAVITPLEESINGVEGMDYITSTASPGSAMIQIMFRQGMNPDMCAVNVQNRVSQATPLLPSEVNQIGVRVVKRQSSQVLMISLTSDGRYDDEFLTNYNAINIVPALKRIQGVGDASSFSAKTYAMRIWLKPDVLKQHNLMPSDIAGVLAEQNIEAAPGKFGEQSKGVAYEYAMRYTGRFRSAEEFGNIIIKSDTNGQTLKLKDVAKIELGGEGYSVSMKNNGIPSIMTMVQQVAGSNANEIAKQVKAELEEQSKLFPPGMYYKINYDVTEFLYASIEEVIFTLFFTLFLVFVVIYVFLQDWRSTLIPLIAVPVSLIGTFFFLNVMGFSINLLTLSALLLAIAIVVDDAIVVVEAVHAKLDQGYKSTLTASIDAMNEISGAIISITLVMASVFIPVSFIGGTSGAFYREFGVTMAVSIFISALNALTLSPALCAIFLKPHDKDGHKKLSRIDRFHLAFNTAYDKILGKYKGQVQKLVHKPIPVITTVILAIVVMVGTFSFTKTGLVPDEDTGTLFCTITMPPATSEARTKEIVAQVDSILAADPAIQSREQIQGYNFIAGSGSDQATFILKLKPFSERQKGLWWKISGLWQGDGIYRFFLNPYESTGVIAQIFVKTAHIKDAQILAFAPPMVPGFSLSSGISLVMQDRTGGSLDKFFGIVKDYLAELNKRPEFQTAQTSYNPNYPQYMVHVDVAKCKQSGISPTTVLSTLQGYFGGLYASNFNSYGKLYRVMIQGTPESRMTPESLKSIYVRTPGGMAPVQEFCQLERVYGPMNISRFNLFTSINVTATVANGYSTGEALNAAREVAADVLPAGYSYDFSGLTREEAKASNTTAIIFVLCFIFIYLILSAQYESYILPLAVVLSIPFGLAGCFLFTMMFGHANDIYMQISLIMLIGLLAKNAILIVQFALERRHLGMAITWSAILGAAARLRPILMTSLAMVVGLLPMMFASGVGKNGNQTLGAAAVGGMLIGTLFQIIVVPGLFVIFQSLQEKISPMKFDDENQADVATEIAQYAHRPVDYEPEK
ncbi:hydrophobic/amphiphilic exporter-1, HAE1 family [Prevotellaceae bacterium HUN156]|nr:hydrophobic/amphiphilic exporter-1, HAE1 family [Prevotellaceae bacterium HUN156]